MSEKVITIDPITRLEGHGKISIFLDQNGDVSKAYFQGPELRGFEKFCEGRLAEHMPRITTRICGVCPTAHHMASTKALDDLFKVDPPPAAKKIREYFYNAHMVEDHTLHLFFLGGPDFVMTPQASKADRNILGVISKLGLEAGKKVIGIRREIRDMMAQMAGKTTNPVFGLPGGISKPLNKDGVEEAKKVAKQSVEFAQWAVEVFNKIVIGNPDYVNLIKSETYTHRTYYMGLVDKKNQVNFYDGDIRVVDPEGSEYARFAPRQYLDYITERAEPWTYVRPTYLKNIGWKGYVDGKDSGIYRVTCLARLNVSDGLSTPLASKEYQHMYSLLGGKPVHYTLAFHWARAIEALYAAERMAELAEDPELADSNVRTLPTKTPTEGVGCVEAARGTLIHHYKTDDRGLITNVNLIVATQHNIASICMSVEKAAKGLIKGGKVSDGLLDMVEMAFRAYDPCIACATHSLPGQMPLEISIHDHAGKVINRISRL